jgi:heat-inducible transcriptional repressor
MVQEELNERERSILRYVIQQFILTALPVGSRNITKKYDIGVSPATVRNIMSDLEESGFIDHPHTSAGRIPTDKGYRFYVDTLMDIPRLPHSDKGLINKSLENNVVDTDELLRLASSLLSSITHQIACVTYPKLDTGILGKIQLISLSSSRILIVITITAGLVKTITLELNTEIQERQLESVQSLLNERLSGLTLKEIRSTFRERFQDFAGGEHPVIRLFFDSAEKIFKDVRQSDNLYITGAKNVIKQPEFEDPGKFQGVIELIEDKDIIIHILDKTGEAAQNQVFISIGSENQDQKLNEYSFISKEYKLGDISGTLGIIGPKRMEYSKVVAIVDYVAKMLTEILRNESR